ncbi:conserved hypothetical protein [Tolumonas auensis DSM 9187]|uniref:Uncharacterized protein n=1 Tax=Tolumonas auensis (strain DSM 9187 / NBRC 110442 / TA 4) TaxID=595494 RepID=C4L8Z7_TOLAT|nr:SIR2 family protein [Tolumonas auensis]ACQ93867.1 conserved hypothetical protein [Tolumonas auensis DSM 9187]
MSEIINKIDISKIYEQDLNFLFGAGASFGLFPTLATQMKDENGNYETIETLAHYFESKNKKNLNSLLFMYYYKECIEPVMKFNWSENKGWHIDFDDRIELEVMSNYKALLFTLFSILDKKHHQEKKVNIFTTNYDSCFVEAYEELLEENKTQLNLNDGSNGFKRKVVEARNFDSIQVRKSTFDKNATIVPQVNIIHLHGSAYWRKKGESIEVQYHNNNNDRLIERFPESELKIFKSFIKKSDSKKEELKIEFSSDFDEIEKEFWVKYNKLPIVNPTKWKFYETVFEEHYYQMLRYMSYQLEKRQSTLIVFGFSFADEHIRHLVKRSLSNNYLTMYICCFDDSQLSKMKSYFAEYANVKFIKIEQNLNFSEFNNNVFSITPLV